MFWPLADVLPFKKGDVVAQGLQTQVSLPKERGYLVALYVLEGGERGPFLCSVGEGDDVDPVFIAPRQRLVILFSEPVFGEFPFAGLAKG
jgi:hypothetical protein